MNWQRAIAPIFFAACLVLGGASAAGLEANLLLQFGAIAVLALAFFVKHDVPTARPARQLVALLVMMLSLIAVQLVPLPPSLWASLPGREAVVEGYRMLGMPLPWMPVSLAPYRTIASAAWLLPPVALLIAMFRLDVARLNWFAWVLLVVVTLSAGIGSLQAASGEGSPWYFYAVTNFGVGTGFFANANHLATLLVASLPFLAALYLETRSRGRSQQKASAMTMVVVGGLIITLIGLAVNRSIAGLGLAVPVLAASGLMILSRRRKLPPWSAIVVGLLLAGSVVAAFTAPFGNNLTGAEARNSEESRFVSFSRTLPAAVEYLPIGSGISTFPEIYPTLENPARIDRFYMNHVHSDYIELLLETGLPGVLLILLFLAWWGRRTISVWSADEPNHFARAASIATAAILAHSIVDYPLRTVAISALFAVACAIMAEPRPRIKRAVARSSDSEARHLTSD
jgi:O-antigen ligase